MTLLRLFPVLLLLFATAAPAQFTPTVRAPAPRIGTLVGPHASPGGGGRQVDPGTWRETRDIRDRVDAGRRSGQLSRREARGLKHEAAAINRMADRYARDGLSDDEARELAVRTQILRDEVLARRSGVDLTPARGVGQRGR